MAAIEQFWPNNARLAVSFSLMFEAGGQPISGAGGVNTGMTMGQPGTLANGEHPIALSGRVCGR